MPEETLEVPGEEEETFFSLLLLIHASIVPVQHRADLLKSCQY